MNCESTTRRSPQGNDVTRRAATLHELSGTGVEKNTMFLRGEATKFQSLLPTLDGCDVAMLHAVWIFTGLLGSGSQKRDCSSKIVTVKCHHLGWRRSVLHVLHQVTSLPCACFSRVKNRQAENDDSCFTMSIHVKLKLLDMQLQNTREASNLRKWLAGLLLISDRGQPLGTDVARWPPATVTRWLSQARVALTGMYSVCGANRSYIVHVRSAECMSPASHYLRTHRYSTLYITCKYLHVHMGLPTYLCMSFSQPLYQPLVSSD